MSRAPMPAAFKQAVKQGWSFKQHARHVCTAVGYLFGLLHSPTGGQEREPEEVQEPAARKEGRKADRKKARVWAEGLMLDDNEVVWCGVERDGGEEGGRVLGGVMMNILNL
jgi:hypothetical protein